MFILYGEDGNNGKTTAANIFEINGDYGVTVGPATIMENYSNKNN